MKRAIIAGLIITLIFTVLNFAGFFSPGFNPDGYRGGVVRITWQSVDGLVTLQTESLVTSSNWPTNGTVYHDFQDISVSVDDRWTAITARHERGKERYLIRNERILEIRVR